MKRSIISFFIILLCVCNHIKATDYDPVVVRINNLEITKAYIEYNLRQYGDDFSKKDTKHFMDSLILDRVKVQEAKRQGIDTSFVYLNKVAEYSHQLANQLFSQRLDNSSFISNSVDSLEYLQIYHLYQPIPQHAGAVFLEEKIELFNSLHSILEREPSLIKEYVEKYSDITTPYWVRQKQNVIEFDSKVLSLGVGAISEPFLTPSGVHLVKVISKKKFPGKEKKSDWKSLSLEELDVFLSNIKQSYDFSYTYETPWKTNNWEPKSDQVLFTLNGKEYTKNDFDYFSRSNLSSINKQYVSFLLKSIFDEQYLSLATGDKEIEYSLMDYKHKLLLEELTRRELEKRQPMNQLGLQRFFEENKKDYKFQMPRYQGLIVSCSNRKVARRVKKILRRNNQEVWTEFLREEFKSLDNEFVKVEEGPFVIGENSCIDKNIFKQGSYTPSSTHPRLVIKGAVEWYPTNYLEVKEQVATDYKAYLKKKWEENLIANSDIEFNKEALKTVNKH